MQIQCLAFCIGWDQIIYSHHRQWSPNRIAWNCELQPSMIFKTIKIYFSSISFYCSKYRYDYLSLVLLLSPLVFSTMHTWFSGSICCWCRRRRRRRSHHYYLITNTLYISREQWTIKRVFLQIFWIVWINQSCVYFVFTFSSSFSMIQFGVTAIISLSVALQYWLPYSMPNWPVEQQNTVHASLSLALHPTQFSRTVWI